MRLSATGKGESDPVADNDSASGRQQNRRVEVIIGKALHKRSITFEPAQRKLRGCFVRGDGSDGVAVLHQGAHRRGIHGSVVTKCYLCDWTSCAPNPKCARTFAMT